MIWLRLIFVTWLPLLEIRASVPLGILHDGLPWWQVALVCIAANAALAWPVWLGLHFGTAFFLRFEFIARLWVRLVERARMKVAPFVDRWGPLGLALFVAVPLPGSGVYSGLLGAFVLGMRGRKALPAAALGAALAGAAVTAITLSGVEAFDFLLKTDLPGGLQ